MNCIECDTDEFNIVELDGRMVCDWKVRIPYCQKMNMFDSFVCDQCYDGYFFENGQCIRCSKRFKYCDKCDAESCSECIQEFELKDDGLCWEDHCIEYLNDQRNFCLSCEVDEFGQQWLRNENTGKCVLECDENT